MSRAAGPAGAWCAAGAAAAMCPAADAATIWSGPPVTFTKPNFVDWTLPEYQDRIIDGVWITRANAAGIFNIAVEPGYSPASPTGTEWATGTAADWESLTFAPWVEWNGNQPGGTINVDAVVHLIDADIYIDIKFLSWTCCANGGGFSYIRSTVPGPAALPALALGWLAAACGGRRRRG